MRSAPLLLVLLSFARVSAASEAVGPNRLFQPAASGVSPVAQTLDAATLANEGRSAPDLLVAAARVAAQASPSVSSRSKKTEGARSPAVEKPLELEPARLLEQAASAARAAGLSDLAKHAAALQGKGLPAGKRGGAYHQTERVAAGATDVFEISFKAGEPAQVGIVGLGGADLDLRVFDEAWNDICGSTGDSSREYCSWVPATTGMFRIRVRNQGKAVEDYVLATN